MNNFWLSILICKLTCYAFFANAASNIECEDLLAIKRSSVFIPTSLGNIYLHHDQKGFRVISEGKNIPVYKHNIESFLRDVNNEELSAFLNVGNLIVGASYSSIKEEMEYTLRGYIRVLGGMDSSLKDKKLSSGAKPVVVGQVAVGELRADPEILSNQGKNKNKNKGGVVHNHIVQAESKLPG